MKWWLIRSVCALLHFSGIVPGLCAIVRRLRPHVFYVFTFHRVLDNSQNLSEVDCVSVSLGTPTKEEFETWLRYFRSRFKVVSLREGLSLLGGRDTRQDLAAVTFDDGYSDNFAIAFPVAQSLSVPITVFLVTDAIGGEWHSWDYQILSMVAGSQKTEVFIPEITARKWRMRTLQEKARMVRYVQIRLRGMGYSAKKNLMRALAESLQIESDNQNQGIPMLSWDEIKMMRQRGCLFGSHTCSHPNMAMIPEFEARKEMLHSKHKIEAELGEGVRFFAYPFGKQTNFSKAHQRLAREVGFSFAFSMIEGANYRDTNPFAMRRIYPFGTPYVFDAYLLALDLRDMVWRFFHRECR